MYKSLFGALIVYMNLNSVFSLELKNKSSAAKYCSTKGKQLLALSLFSDSASHVEELNKYIKEGQDFWISDFAKYTPFVSFRSCFEKLTESPYTGYNISACVELCDKKGLPYVGFKTDYCYCLASGYDTHITALPSRQCDSMEKMLAGEKVFRVNVFEIHKFGHLFENSTDSNSKRRLFYQCVAAKKNDDKQTPTKANYTTLACRDSGQQITNGYICTHGAATEMNSSCGSIVNSEYCIKESAKNWFEASKSCLDYNGKLVSIINENLVGKMTSNNFYWTGIFRYFSIVPTNKKEMNFCLSVRKHQNRWMIEPDDCSALKMVLCYNDITQENDFIHFSKTETKSIQTARYSNVNGNVTQPTKILTTEGETGSPKMLIILVVSLVTIFIILVVTVVFVRNRQSKSELCSRKKKQVTENDLTNKTRAELSESIQTGRNSRLEDNPNDYEEVPAVTEPNHIVTSDKTDENIYDRTNQKYRDNISEDGDQRNIYHHTIAEGAALNFSENIYDSNQTQTGRKVTARENDKHIYDLTEKDITVNEEENHYNKTNDIAVDNVACDIYNHTSEAP